ADDAPIIIHPGAGAARKCWPAERFVSLARILASSGASVRFVIGEVEREQWPQQRLETLHRVTTIEQPQSYLDLFDLIRQARLFVAAEAAAPAVVTQRWAAVDPQPAAPSRAGTALPPRTSSSSPSAAWPEARSGTRSTASANRASNTRSASAPASRTGTRRTT